MTTQLLTPAPARPPPTDPRPPRTAPGLAALRALAEPVRHAPGAGVVWTLIVAIPTFGVLPGLWWALGWRKFVAVERRRYLALAEWVKFNASHPAADQLERRARAMGKGSPLLWIVMCCLMATIVYGFVIGQDNPKFLLGYGYRWLNAPNAVFWTHPHNADGVEWLIWGWVFLVAAYAVHWSQVQAYAARVRKFLDAFNTVALHDSLAPVFLQPIGSGIRPLWALAAFFLLLAGAPWGIPLMLAGAVQRRYTRHAGPAAGAAVLDRVWDWAALNRPPGAAAPSRQRCATAGCKMPLPAGSRFCPRCGARTSPSVDRVA